MTILEFSLLVWAGSVIAGFLGALTGLGGGVVLVSMLSLLLGVDIRYAIGASLVSVIATSSGGGSLRKRGFFQHPDRDVSGDRYVGCAPWRNPGDALFQQCHCHCFWIGADRLRVPVQEAPVEK
jgi:hypothetical protein